MPSAVLFSIRSYPAYPIGIRTGTPVVCSSKSSRIMEKSFQYSFANIRYRPNCLTHVDSFVFYPKDMDYIFIFIFILNIEDGGWRVGVLSIINDNKSSNQCSVSTGNLKSSQLRKPLFFFFLNHSKKLLYQAGSPCEIGRASCRERV